MSERSTSELRPAPVCDMMHIKQTLERVAYVAPAGFLSRYLSGPLPYNRK